MKFTYTLIFLSVLCINNLIYAQEVAMSKASLIALTPKWDGERFPDGRPRVSDELLQRLKSITLEQAWSVLKGEGYHHQLEQGWETIHTGQVLVGRVLSAQYMPLRPEIRKELEKEGEKAGRIGDMVSWPIDLLQKGDVYVADSYGKHNDGPIIGDNLATSIITRSGNGVVFNGTVRDVEGLRTIPGFTSFFRGSHPSYQQEMMLTGINVPIRIGPVTVVPGDVVLGKQDGVMFIPPHLVEKVVKAGELVQLRDQFGHQRLKEGKYTPGQIDGKWTPEIDNDFAAWRKTNNK
jgi:4-hydroxy-4-methyl-2-oxoglutarate aldolase